MTDYENAQKEAEFEWLTLYKSGPTNTTWKALPPQVGDQAPDLNRLGSDGQNVRLSSLWRDGPLLLIFWRHFGCTCGVERAGRLLKEYSDYIDAGANVVIVGQGEPERATEYAKKYELENIPILCDPDYSGYFKYGLLEGKESQILFDAPIEMIERQLKIGQDFYEQRKSEGRPPVDNPWLLPGEFVIDENGILRLTYRYNYCEDYPDPRVLLTAIREAKSI